MTRWIPRAPVARRRDSGLACARQGGAGARLLTPRRNACYPFRTFRLQSPEQYTAAPEDTPMTSFRRSLPFVLVLLLLLLPSAGLAAGVAVMGTPFPSAIYTVPDPGPPTGNPVNLPKPSCAAEPHGCGGIHGLNTPHRLHPPP